MHHIVNNYMYVAFSGSRDCRQAADAAAATCLFVKQSAVVSVGDAKGVDRAVRTALPKARIYTVDGPFGRGAFAKRTAQMVEAQPPSYSLLCAFPSTPCPAGVQISGKFNGHGSGTWGAVALALHKDLDVLVFIPAFRGWDMLGKLRHRFTKTEQTKYGTWFFAPRLQEQCIWDLFNSCPSPEPCRTKI